MKSEKKMLHCICCPLGCEITASLEDGQVVAVCGNSCPRGEKYAREELTAPQRMLTMTVRILQGKLPLLPVVSARALPKERISDCARALRRSSSTQTTTKASRARGRIFTPSARCCVP